MKRLISFVSCLLLLASIPFCAFAEDEPERVVIAMINYETGAQNFPIEEAFFKEHPNATIEYRIYSGEQFNGVLMNGQCDFDLAIATYSLERAMLERGYIQTLDTIGLTEYPEQLIDLSHLLMVDGKLIGIPLWEVQECYFWDAGMARKAGVSYPAAAGYWTWEDFAELCRQLPKDTDGDGEPDVYLMYGSSLADCPYLQNVEPTMILNYFKMHSDDMDTFFTKYFDLFREIFTSDALLAFDRSETKKHVIISYGSGLNPIDRAGTLMPIPVFSADEDYQMGGVTSLVLMQNAPHAELAADFLHAALSDEALSLFFGDETRLMAKKAPAKRVTNQQTLKPVFSDVDGIKTAYVTAGRRYFTSAYSAGGYNKAQEFRAKLFESTFPGTSDFHGAVWSYLQEWYLGHISDAELQESVTYLVEMALEE